MTVATDGDGTGAAADRPGTPRDPAPPPRQALVTALATAIIEGAGRGDLELARLAHKALGRLLGLTGGEATSPVLDLDAFRRQRDES